jgi:hypothetical protein
LVCSGASNKEDALSPLLFAVVPTLSNSKATRRGSIAPKTRYAVGKEEFVNVQHYGREKMGYP